MTFTLSNVWFVIKIMAKTSRNLQKRTYKHKKGPDKRKHK